MKPTKTEAITGFSAWAATYDETVAKEVEQYSGMAYEEMLQRVVDAAEVTHEARVLDIGTGTGALALRVAQHLSKGHLVAIDPTEAMLRRAEENILASGLGDCIELQQASAEALPFPDASFDVVISSIALHHTTVRRSLPEIARVLKPGGRLAIAEMSLTARWQGCLSLLLPPITGLYYLFVTRSIPMMRAEMAALRQVFPKEAWEAMLHDAGFCSAEITEFRHPKQEWYPSMLIMRASK